MMQVLVDIPRLEDGQVLSSGGSRQNGRLAHQYCNPRPYHPEEPRSSQFKQEFRDFIGVIAIDAGHMAWDELGRPLVRKGMSKVTEMITILFSSKELKANRILEEHEARKRAVISQLLEQDDSVVTPDNWRYG